jgi:hypothetical protein
LIRPKVRRGRCSSTGGVYLPPRELVQRSYIC